VSATVDHLFFVPRLSRFSLSPPRNSSGGFGPDRLRVSAASSPRRLARKLDSLRSDPVIPGFFGALRPFHPRTAFSPPRAGPQWKLPPRVQRLKNFDFLESLSDVGPGCFRISRRRVLGTHRVFQVTVYSFEYLESTFLLRSEREEV